MRSRLLAATMGVAAIVSLAAAPASPARPATQYVDEIDNQYFPLEPGSQLVYRGTRDGQPTRDVVNVTDRTIVIQGVTNTVVHDDLYVAGTLFETTDDYYAQDADGNVHYFGEDTKELDAQGHVISTEGTWRAGVQGARNGIIMLGHPQVGQTYREEFFKGHAEDQAKVLSLSETLTVPFGTFHDVLKTKNFTRLDPGVIENKYYGKGVGIIHEQDIKGGSDSSDLVSFTSPNGGDGHQD
jgi:hypothetical protein